MFANVMKLSMQYGRQTNSDCVGMFLVLWSWRLSVLVECAG